MLICIGIYFFIVNCICSIPELFKTILDITATSDINKIKIYNVLITMLFLISSSKILYSKVQNILVSKKEKTKSSFLNEMYETFISINDLIKAIPKRTFLFSVYLVIIIGSIQVKNSQSILNWEFVICFSIAMESLLKYAKEEIKELMQYGERVYGNK